MERLGAARHRLSWIVDRPLPITSDRPTIVAQGEGATPAQVSDDGRTLSIVVESSTPPDPDQYDVLLSGQQLDSSTPRELAPIPDKARPAGTLLKQDPAAPGTFQTQTSNYTQPSVRVPGYKHPIEMIGHVVAPAAHEQTGPRPLVLFLHGRHSSCYEGDEIAYDVWPCRPPAKPIENHLGYDYLQRRLASQGYTTVSIRVNGINAQDETDPQSGAGARALIVRRHLDHWASMAAERGVDMSRVVLVGHSRGGEGVNRASLQIPLSAPYRIVGQVLIAPTNFAAQTSPYVPTAALLPSCDGDVTSLDGQLFIDLSRDLLSDDTSLKSSVLMIGANHNFFNTEWTPGTASAPAVDDWWGEADMACGVKDPNRMGAKEQRDAGLAYVTAAVRLFASGQHQFARLFTGEDVRVASTGNSAIRSHALGAGRTALRPGQELTAHASEHARVGVCTGLMGDPDQTDRCGHTVEMEDAAPHWYPSDDGPLPRPGLDFAWSRASGESRLTLSHPIDLTTRRLALRTVVDQAFPRIQLKVRLADGAGRSALLTPALDGVVPRTPGGPATGKWWAQTVFVDPTSVKPADLDLSDVRHIDLVGVSDSGRMVLLDASVVPEALAEVPVRRAATVSVDALPHKEGDQSQPVTVQVPVRVSGTVAETGRVRVRGFDEEGNEINASFVVSPGSTEFLVPVSYQPDRIAAPDRMIELTAYADSGLVTDDYKGGLNVLDDDPLPVIRVRAVRSVVREGQTIRILVSMPKKYDDSLGVEGTFLRVKGPRLRVHDVRRSFFHVPPPPHTPLWRADRFLWADLEAGHRSVVLEVPTRRDKRQEQVERVKIRVTVHGQTGRFFTKDVVVAVKDRPVPRPPRR